MKFNTLEYLVFLPLVAMLCHASPRGVKLPLLLVASYVFYASWNPWFLILIIGLTLANYAIGLGLAARRGNAAIFWLGIAVNLSTLGVFKYSAFIAANVAALSRLAGLHLPVPSFSSVSPLGISFFVFEFVHYLADVKKGEPVVRSPLKFALFAAFFPTQIAGPIKRFESFIPQLDALKLPSAAMAMRGARLVVLGLFKKAAVADNLARIANNGFAQAVPGMDTLHCSEAWIGVLAFAFQIYFDFSGYTDIGRGSALLLGFDVPENFARPYLATSVSEFWRRWHISLSTWLRDYLYIPLGGGRRARYRNLLLTMVLGGLWHGANWTFVAWGALHGCFLVVHRVWEKTGAGVLSPSQRAHVVFKITSWALTFGAVCFAWVPFRAKTMAETGAMWKAMFGLGSGRAAFTSPSERLFVLAVVLLTLAIEVSIGVAARRAAIRGTDAFARSLSWLEPAGWVALAALTLVAMPSGATTFIYFQF